MDMETITHTLVQQHGWTSDSQARAAEQTQADQRGMSAEYPYKVLGVFKQGDVVIIVEQNTSSESAGGLTSIIEHPPVANVVGPRGRATVALADVQAILAVAQAVQA